MYILTLIVSAAARLRISSHSWSDIFMLRTLRFFSGGRYGRPTELELLSFIPHSAFLIIFCDFELKICAWYTLIRQYLCSIIQIRSWSLTIVHNDRKASAAQPERRRIYGTYEPPYGDYIYDLTVAIKVASLSLRVTVLHDFLNYAILSIITWIYLSIV